MLVNRLLVLVFVNPGKTENLINPGKTESEKLKSKAIKTESQRINNKSLKADLKLEDKTKTPANVAWHEAW